MGERTDDKFLGIDTGLERNSRALEQKIRRSDPRDYLRVTTFQKHARAIDKDLSHSWETEPDSFIWLNDPGCEVVVATVSNPKNMQKDLLLATRANGNELISACLKNLESSVRDFTSEVTGLVVKRFPVAEKFVFIQNLIKVAPELANETPDRAAFKIASLAVDLLPDYPTAELFDRKIKLPRVNYGEPEASSQQRTDLQRFLVLLSAKMPSEVFLTSLDKFVKDIPFTDHIYGRNFKYIFSDALGWMVTSRPDTKISDSYPERTDRAATFPVKDLVKRKIGSPEELRKILSEMPVKPEPFTLNAKHGPNVAEFVDLEKIVGGPGITNWSVVSTSIGRGFENIKRFAEDFTNGTIDVSGYNQPISLSEVGGYYFIRGDGRHRVAAMKALGVPFAPMMVTHIW